MAPMETSESDELDQLPSVPRRRSSGRPPLPRSERAPTRARRREEGPLSKRRRKRSPRRQNAKRRAKKSELLHSDEDENDNDESDHPRIRRLKRPKRGILQSRKIIDDDDDDDENDDDNDNDNDNDNGGSDLGIEERGESDPAESNDREFESKSDSISPPRLRRSKHSKGNSSDSREEENDEQAHETADTDGNEMIPGQIELLARLEEEDAASEEFDSEDIEQVEKSAPKSRIRLTSRQRAMQGEDVKLEYVKLESPKSKKKEPEDWDHDEEMELKKQQKARLRQMIHEKRNKEKRAAMVDKVLRGVTSKRKKFTLASEARAAQVGTRLSQNEMREGCIRFISNREGSSISIPANVEAPMYLSTKTKAIYPKPCKRDPKTGKRIRPV